MKVIVIIMAVLVLWWILQDQPKRIDHSRKMDAISNRWDTLNTRLDTINKKLREQLSKASQQLKAQTLLNHGLDCLQKALDNRNRAIVALNAGDYDKWNRIERQTKFWQDSSMWYVRQSKLVYPQK